MKTRPPPKQHRSPLLSQLLNPQGKACSHGPFRTASKIQGCRNSLSAFQTCHKKHSLEESQQSCVPRTNVLKYEQTSKLASPVPAPLQTAAKDCIETHCKHGNGVVCVECACTQAQTACYREACCL
ncbi:hypothetical protein ACRRTK_023081 [Alexandromys fortis]